MSSIGWWTLDMRPWNQIVAIDEFGPGTLDGNPADGGSNDGCGPATAEMAAAAYEGRAPSYENIGHIRVDMITNGQWSAGASVSNPRTGGCFLDNLAWEMPRRHYVAGPLVEPSTDGNGNYRLLDVQTLHEALRFHAAVIFNVLDAGMLIGNEAGLIHHFVVAAGYGGDSGTIANAPAGYFDAHGFGKVYLLNSDVAGQHGIATGQWTPLDILTRAQVVGYVVMERPAPPAPPPAPQPDIPGAVVDINTIQQIVDKAVADALSKLQPK